MALGLDQPTKLDSLPGRLQKMVKLGWTLATKGRQFQKWMNTTAEHFVTRFKDPLLRDALLAVSLQEFSMFFMLFTFAYLHAKNAGYPVGGSLPMSQAIAQRYLDLGGAIHYRNPVEKILVEGSGPWSHGWPMEVSTAQDV